jgi:hypothetical protein
VERCQSDAGPLPDFSFAELSRRQEMVFQELRSIREELGAARRRTHELGKAASMITDHNEELREVIVRHAETENRRRAQLQEEFANMDHTARRLLFLIGVAYLYAM